MELKYGVQKGSCAGPMHNTMYASTLAEVLEKLDISIMGYTDDHALFSLCLDKETISPTIGNIEVGLKK